MATPNPSPIHIEYAMRWAQLHGLCMAVPYSGADTKTKKSTTSTQPPEEWVLSDKYYYEARHAPFVLSPSPFPKHAYDEGVALCKPYNLLIDRVARDSKFLTSTLERAAASDEFTKRLLDVYSAARAAFGAGGNADGNAYDRSWMLGIHRSDYMLHGTGNGNGGRGTLRQIEINTIAVSFAALGTLTSRLHATMVARFGFAASVLENPALPGVVGGLEAAFRQYGASKDAALVLFVVQAGEGNLFDQRHLEDHLFEAHGIHSLRLSLTDLGHIMKKEERKRGALRLRYEGKLWEVAVVYFRAGYTPADYPSADGIEWAAREAIEVSDAIKCPSVAYQLAGAKKIQQVLANEGVVERFLEPKDAALVRASFAGLYALDDESIALALKTPGSYVLKPQREGGGNNIYDDDLVRALKTMSEAEQQAYILMERITPPIRAATPFVRDGVVLLDDAVSEFGVFGVFLGNGSRSGVLSNRFAGHLLRTKATRFADGGVAAGVAYLDSPAITCSSCSL